MNLFRYIKGLRHGKDAHYVELEAMKDPFLSEALEGYDAVEGDHLKRIILLQRKVKNYNRKKKNKTTMIKPASTQIFQKTKINISWKKWGLVAVFLLCLLFGTYVLLKNHDSTPTSKMLIIPESQEKMEETVAEQENKKDTLQPEYIPELPIQKNKQTTFEETLPYKVQEEEEERFFFINSDSPPIEVQITDSQSSIELIHTELSFDTVKTAPISLDHPTDSIFRSHPTDSIGEETEIQQ